MADKVTVSGPALEGAQYMASSELIFTIGDGAGQGPLGVSVKSQLTPKPLEVKDNGNGTMSVLFTPRATGKHIFELKWGNDPIKQSPIEVEVTGEVQRDPSKVVVERSEEGIVNQPVKMEVTAPDEAGPGPLQVDASGPSEPEIELQNIGNGKFSVQLKVTKPGSYKVAVAWGDCAVPGSPFTIEIKAEESKE
jgi:filamin|uniref:Uncharacterized protein n=1 Tax=Eutreptiella gymnastica TaxID=73025 RepID=A0A7S4LN52_9EUGL|eukprot:CAMPEP_0174286674 /NCGR_PEP_ID=MMETSP0809-20121228/12750_1 /TAXON_ID=73025 ORGANISM="Eutreptiella gymnastica-like, Strain CCMP1594" /NCGR_SAMPLE_ID=MMETSP0809 /ASSEMBLY_ACC=CAM_ASM_000658 /LENGTH=192 /DNA_ID=CAMNT_0015382837 /DNA_START=53 /DNA_END=631 /DNA_ORIENTATION=-